MANIDKEKFGNFISLLRKEKNMTQSELAKQLNISAKAVSKWETGVSLPDINLLTSIADALDVSVAELLQYKRNKNEEIRSNEVEEIIQKTISISDAKWKEMRNSTFRLIALVVSFVLTYLLQFICFPKWFPALFPRSPLAGILLISSILILILCGTKLITKNMIFWTIGVLVYLLLIMNYSSNGAYHLIPVLDHSNMTYNFILKRMNSLTPLLLCVLILFIVFCIKVFPEISKPKVTDSVSTKRRIQFPAYVFHIIWSIVVFFGYWWCITHQINPILPLWFVFAGIGFLVLIFDGPGIRSLDVKNAVNSPTQEATIRYDLNQRRKTAKGSTFTNTLAYMTVPLILCILYSIFFL